MIVSEQNLQESLSVKEFGYVGFGLSGRATQVDP